MMSLFWILLELRWRRWW